MCGMCTAFCRHFSKYFQTDPSTKLPPGFTRAGNRSCLNKTTLGKTFSICLVIGRSAQSAQSPLASQFMCRVRKMLWGEKLDSNTSLLYIPVANFLFNITDKALEMMPCAFLIVHIRGHLVVKHDSLGEILLQATEISEARQVVCC